jgi:hypothetical protein
MREIVIDTETTGFDPLGSHRVGLSGLIHQYKFPIGFIASSALVE